MTAVCSTKFKHQKIVIVGLGKSGLASLDFFVAQQAQVFAMDNKPLNLEPKAGVEYHFGEWREDWLLNADLIVLSPGISLATPAIQKAIDTGVKVVGDIEVFCQMNEIMYRTPILAITGSNGKSTVTSLVHAMAEIDGLKVAMGGNIGVTVLSLLKEKYDLLVFELSSFQLETTDSLKALGATVLNVSDDHLNRYDNSLEKYRQAKLKIYQNCQNLVINSEDPLTLPESKITLQNLGKKWFFGESQGDFCVQNINDKRYLMAKGEVVLACQELGIKGKHNEQNAIASIALAMSANISLEAIQTALREFKGLDHRFQTVHVAEGVTWINDSKATNIGSTLAGLNGIAPNQRLHLLLGGDGKGADFSQLQSVLDNPYIFCYCFGQDGEQIAKFARQAQVFTTMQEAISAIKTQLQTGDVVLLSPACASLDQFKSFQQRGEIFAQLAKS